MSEPMIRFYNAQGAEVGSVHDGGPAMRERQIPIKFRRLPTAVEARVDGGETVTRAELKARGKQVDPTVR